MRHLTSCCLSLYENSPICKKLKALTDHLGLDYAAADFMTNTNGELTFLEVNSFPMFARFDMESDFAISKSIVEFLLS
ncbi:MAG: hypothetical protein AAF621_07260 [Pseudomonadota bacterium]